LISSLLARAGSASATGTATTTPPRCRPNLIAQIGNRIGTNPTQIRLQGVIAMGALANFLAINQDHAGQDLTRAARAVGDRKGEIPDFGRHLKHGRIIAQQLRKTTAAAR
jgi:hypothetical protein